MLNKLKESSIVESEWKWENRKREKERSELRDLTWRLQLHCKALYGYFFDIIGYIYDIMSEVQILITRIEFIKEPQGLQLALEGLYTKLGLLGHT